MSRDPSARIRAEQLARTFMRRVWTLPHDLSTIDDLMTDDYVITSAGTVIQGRAAFAAWVADFHRALPDATNRILDLFAAPAGDRVVSRWVCTGRNNGIFGSLADGRRVSFSGIAIWAVRNDRLSECWVERSALEPHIEPLERDDPLVTA